VVGLLVLFAFGVNLNLYQYGSSGITVVFRRCPISKSEGVTGPKFG
jgi:hypothetical protein